MQLKQIVGAVRTIAGTGVWSATVAVLAAGAASATEMDAKARVIRSFDTVRAGRAELTCDDPKGWTFDVRAELDTLGRDVVTVKLVSPVTAERSPVAIACSDAFNRLEFGLSADDRACDMICSFSSIAPNLTSRVPQTSAVVSSPTGRCNHGHRPFHWLMAGMNFTPTRSYLCQFYQVRPKP